MNDETTDELPLGREAHVEPGLLMERRWFLAATAGALAAADSISFKEFLPLVLPEAKAQDQAVLSAQAQ